MFNYEQVMDMNFPCPIEAGRKSINPWGIIQTIDEYGWPCVTEEPIKLGSGFDFRPVPTLEEVFKALPTYYRLSRYSSEDGKIVFVIETRITQISSGNSISEAICDAYLYYKKVTLR